MINSYLEIPEGFWFGNIPFFGKNFNLLHNSPRITFLTHALMPSLAFLLCQFPTLTYYVINCFVSVTT